MKPRVLCLLQLPPPVHGASVMNAAIAQSQRLASEFDLEILPLRYASAIDDIGRFAISKLTRFLRTLHEVTAAIDHIRPDLVYMTFATSGPAFYRDVLLGMHAKRRDVRIAFQLHTKGTSLLTAPHWQQHLARRALRDAWVVHLSPALAESLGPLVDRERVLHVENGIDDRATPRSPSQRPRVLFLSNLRENKGPLVLLEALARLATQGIAFDATVAGAHDGDGCGEAVARFVRQHGLQVRLVGAVYGDEKDELFRTHDIFALPTLDDAFPLVVLEALQWGLPVVATNEGAIPEILGASGAGVLVMKNDAAALADSLRKIIESPATRARMGERARARYLEAFTLPLYEERFAAALHTIISGTARRSVRSSSAPTADVSAAATRDR